MRKKREEQEDAEENGNKKVISFSYSATCF